jgi:hypothetical protein
MTETIVKSQNLFLDSDMHHDTVSTNGDNFEVHLNHINVDAAKGQFIRLTLTNFSMFKNFTNVNQHNNRFVLRDGTNNPQEINLTQSNYATINEIAENFAEKVKDQFNTWKSVSNITYTVLAPAPTGSSNNVISFELDFQTAHNYNANNVLVQFYERYDGDIDSDIFALLGGDRIKAKFDATDGNTTNSITVDANQANKLIFTCKYPAQRFTEQFVYLKTNLLSNNLETTSLNSRRGSGHQEKVCDVHQSDIFARFPIDNEFIHWDTQSDREFFIDLPINQNHLNYMRFFLTNKRGRNLGFAANQNTLGNLNFTMVLKIDIIQKFSGDSRFTKDPVRTVPPRWSNPQIDYDGHAR